MPTLEQNPDALKAMRAFALSPEYRARQNMRSFDEGRQKGAEANHNKKERQTRLYKDTLGEVLGDRYFTSQSERDQTSFRKEAKRRYKDAWGLAPSRRAERDAVQEIKEEEEKRLPATKKSPSR